MSRGSIGSLIFGFGPLRFGLLLLVLVAVSLGLLSRAVVGAVMLQPVLLGWIDSNFGISPVLLVVSSDSVGIPVVANVVLVVVSKSVDSTFVRSVFEVKRTDSFVGSGCSSMTVVVPSKVASGSSTDVSTGTLNPSASEAATLSFTFTTTTPSPVGAVAVGVVAVVVVVVGLDDEDNEFSIPANADTAISSGDILYAIVLRESFSLCFTH